MWGRLGDLRTTLREGVQEFTQEFAKEGGELVRDGIQEALAAADKTKLNLRSEGAKSKGSLEGSRKDEGLLEFVSGEGSSDMHVSVQRRFLPDASASQVRQASTGKLAMESETNTLERDDNVKLRTDVNPEIKISSEGASEANAKSPRQRGLKKGTSTLSGKKSKKSTGNRSKRKGKDERDHPHGSEEADPDPTISSNPAVTSIGNDDSGGSSGYLRPTTSKERDNDRLETDAFDGSSGFPRISPEIDDSKSLTNPMDAREQLEIELERFRTRAQQAERDLEQIQQDLSQALVREKKLEQAKAEAERGRESALSEAYQARRSASEASEMVTQERKIREEALAASAQLKGDQERRARQFESAVNAAVTRIKEGLNEENVALQQRLRQVEEALQIARREQAQALKDAEDARMEAAARLKDAQTAGTVAASAEEYAQRVAESRDAQVRRAKDAERALREYKEAQETSRVSLEEALQRAERAEKQLTELSDNLAYERKTYEIRLQQITEDADRWRKEAEKESDSAQRSATSCIELRKRIEDVEEQKKEELLKLGQELENATREIAELKLQKSAKKPQRLFSSDKMDLLGSLGLDKINSTGIRISNEPQVLGGGHNPRRRIACHPVLGTVGFRTAIVVIYILVLHMVVMLSYTRRSLPTEADCHRLPGQD